MSFSFQRIRIFLKSNGWGLGILIGVWLIFFSRTLFFNQVYFLDDLKIIYYPLEHIYAGFQHNWQLPKWSNEFGFGQPLLAWGQLGFFTPLHLLLRAVQMPPIILLQISIMTYFGLGLLGMFFFLRKWKASSMASVLGAIVFVFSGFNVGHLNHVNFYTATMLLPWLLLATDTFLGRPTVHTAVIVSLIVSSITLSGQPQIVLYTLTIAALYGFITFWITLKNHKAIKIIPLTVIAGILTFSLSSFAILPLAEFLPQTERNEDLPPEELYDFSYPPWHTITLIFPYFFGDHTVYWGAKGFQELAAYVGVLPLLLTGSAISYWQVNKAQRIFSVSLVIIGIIFAFGRYSPLYVYLVESHVLSTLSVPGRFTYFFTSGIALLAALGTDDLFRKKASKFYAVIAALAVCTIVFAPFLWHLQTDTGSLFRFEHIGQLSPGRASLAIFGAGLFLVIAALPVLLHASHSAKVAVVICSTVTLIVSGWSYNPLIPRQVALTVSPFVNILQKFKGVTGSPPRLYSHQLLKESANQAQRLAEPINPQFSVHQPIIVQHDNVSCLRLLREIERANSGTVKLAIREQLDAPPLRQMTFSASDIDAREQRICFDPIPESSGKKLFLSFTSNDYTSIRLFLQPTDRIETSAYFVRVAQPTREEYERSRKPFRIILHQEYRETIDSEAALLTRNLQVIAGTSSARWIGALSIKPYREFIEQFFANDRYPIDGEGLHVIQRYRAVFDMAGITHLIQPLFEEADTAMKDAGFVTMQNTNIGAHDVVLYRNPQAYPKVFMVRNAIFKPGADEVRYELLQPGYQPDKLVYIDGPTPPESIPAHSTNPLDAKATITHYEPTRVDVKVNTAEPAFLILTDAATPQWHTYIDDHLVNQLIANTIFRAALMPAGKHAVSFRYYSLAVELSKKLTVAGLAISVALLLIPLIKRSIKSLLSHLVNKV